MDQELVNVNYYDFNGTVSCHSQGKFRDEPTTFIAMGIYGIVDNGRWIPSGKSSHHILPNEISYYDYCKLNFPSDYQEMVRKCTDKGEPCASFSYFKNKIQGSYRSIFLHSFIDILRNPDGRTVIRTYGADTKEMFRGFSKLGVQNVVMGKLCHNFGERRGADFDRNFNEGDDEPYESYFILNETKERFDLHELGEYIRDGDYNVLVIRDDWKAWKNRKYGKKIFKIPGTRQIVFDNNHCVRKEHDVENYYFHHVNTLDAVEDRFYFRRVIETVNFTNAI